MSTWKTAQEESLRTASKWGHTWTTAEIDLLESSMDERVHVVADVLERSVYAVATMRGLIRKGYNVSELTYARKRDVVERVCTECHLTTCDC